MINIGKLNFFKNSLKIFSFNRSKKETTTQFQLMETKGNSIVLWNGQHFKSDIVVSCIQPYVKAIGRLEPQHIREGEDIKVNPEPYIRFLLEEPNPMMSGQMFFEKMAIQLKLNNNAFAYILRDENGFPTAMYNINATSADVIYDEKGNIFLKFYMNNGNITTYNYSDIIHLRGHYGKNDFFGESPRETLIPLIKLSEIADHAIVNAIKNGGFVKWLLKFPGALRPEDIKKQTQDFENQYLTSENGGAAGIDSKCDAQQITPTDYVPNAALIDRVTKRIYNYFGVNEKIISGDFSAEEWNAYFESELKTDIMQMSAEFTRKLFNRKMRGFGNKIEFTCNNLQYASNKDKLELLGAVDRGCMLKDEWRATLHLGHIEGGDVPIMRLDTAELSQNRENNETNDNNNNNVNEAPRGGENK